jgi:two-component system, chemotaxis family, sensor kinase CheA
VGSMDEIVREFLVESYENLDQLDQDLVALEGSPGSRELLSRVFRTIHTIKGACGFLGFGRLESLTHVGESLLSELRDGRRVMDQLTTDVLLHMVDTVREILASIETSGGEGDIVVDGVIEQIRAVLHEPAAQTAPAWIRWPERGRWRTSLGQSPRLTPRSASTSRSWTR